ncbi:MAG: zinc ABC transporter substrate-binding protein [bacterium]
MTRTIALLTIGTLILPLTLIFTVSGCESTSRTHDKPLVFVSIPPHAFFVERIADTLVDVEVLLRPGASPHTFDPTPQQIARLAESDLYLQAGLPFERQIVNRIEAQNPQFSIVNLREGIKPLMLAEHSHGDEASHAEEADPHLWLDPHLARIQAQKIGAALVRLMPEATPILRENLARLTAELTALDDSLSRLLAPAKGRSFWVFHPAYGYLGARYGLHQVAIESEGKEPSARALAGLVEQARDEKIVALFVQPQFSTKSAEVIANAVGCQIVTADPLARDYFDNLYHLGTQLATALAPPKAGDQVD